jgi:NADH-quinone oxidoreductase subunit M
LIEEFGGLAIPLPFFSTIFMIVTLSSIGLPLLNGFVGEFLILLGAFKANRTFAIISTSGVVLSAVYMLWMYQRVIFGEVTNPKNKKLVDLNIREKFVLVPLVVLIFWMGIYSDSFLRKMEVSVNQVLRPVNSSAVALK